MQKVRPILTKLMSAGTGPQRGLFNVPVDPVKLGIPDYFRRVLHPMDLVRRAGEEGLEGPVSLLFGVFILIFGRHLFKLLLGSCVSIIPYQHHIHCIRS